MLAWLVWLGLIAGALGIVPRTFGAGTALPSLFVWGVLPSVALTSYGAWAWARHHHVSGNWLNHTGAIGTFLFWVVVLLPAMNLVQFAGAVLLAVLLCGAMAASCDWWQPQPVLIHSQVPQQPPDPDIEIDDLDDDDSASLPFDESVAAWQTKSVDEEHVIYSGAIAIDFHEGLKETVVHTAFCPPCVRTPEVEVVDLDETGWEMAVSAVYANGARFVVRRSLQNMATGHGRIGYTARAPQRVD